MQIKREDQVINLKGQQKNVGDTFEEVELVNGDGEPVILSNYLDVISIISVIPDITTRVCERQTQYLANEAAKHDYSFVTISTNTPKELNDWLRDHNLDIDILSDKERAFGNQLGIVMEEYDKLARSVYIVDGHREIKYMEIVPEMTDEPDYIKLLKKASDLSQA